MARTRIQFGLTQTSQPAVNNFQVRFHELGSGPNHWEKPNCPHSIFLGVPEQVRHLGIVISVVTIAGATASFVSGHGSFALGNARNLGTPLASTNPH